MDLRIDDYALDARTHVIEVQGEVDLYAAPEFKDRILGVISEGKTSVIVDFSGVSFIDSAALGVLGGVLAQLRGADGALSIVVRDYDIERLIETGGIGGNFSFYRSRAEALEALDGLPAS